MPFKIYAYFESLLKGVKSNNKKNSASYTEKYKSHIPCSFAYKVVCFVDRFRKPVVFYRGNNVIYKFIEAVLEGINYCKKVIKEYFNKSLVMYAEDEEKFRSGHKCWIFNKLFYVGDNKVRDHDHVTGKYRGATHWSCNINFKLTKKVPVTFHNLKD